MATGSQLPAANLAIAVLASYILVNAQGEFRHIGISYIVSNNACPTRSVRAMHTSISLLHRMMLLYIRTYVYHNSYVRSYVLMLQSKYSYIVI